MIEISWVGVWLIASGGTIAGIVALIAANRVTTEAAELFSKGYRAGYDKGIAEGPAYWRNRAAQSDESARILGEALKTAIRERDEARLKSNTYARRLVDEGHDDVEWYASRPIPAPEPAE